MGVIHDAIVAGYTFTPSRALLWGVVTRLRPWSRLEMAAIHGSCDPSATFERCLAYPYTLLCMRGPWPWVLAMAGETTPGVWGVETLYAEGWESAVGLRMLRQARRLFFPGIWARGGREAVAVLLDGAPRTLEYMRFLGFEAVARLAGGGHEGEDLTRWVLRCPQNKEV